MGPTRTAAPLFRSIRWYGVGAPLSRCWPRYCSRERIRSQCRPGRSRACNPLLPWDALPIEVDTVSPRAAGVLRAVDATICGDRAISNAEVSTNASTGRTARSNAPTVVALSITTGAGWSIAGADGDGTSSDATAAGGAVVARASNAATAKENTRIDRIGLRIADRTAREKCVLRNPTNGPFLLSTERVRDSHPQPHHPCQRSRSSPGSGGNSIFIFATPMAWM